MAEFTEVESGKRHTNRPELLRAIELCRRQRAILVTAKLNRLARNVHFILIFDGIALHTADGRTPRNRPVITAQNYARLLDVLKPLAVVFQSNLEFAAVSWTESMYLL